MHRSPLPLVRIEKTIIPPTINGSVPSSTVSLNGDARDGKGFAFRYPRQGDERFEYDFGWIPMATEHVQQILSNILTYLIELHGENEDWQQIPNSF